MLISNEVEKVFAAKLFLLNFVWLRIVVNGLRWFKSGPFDDCFITKCAQAQIHANKIRLFVLSFINIRPKRNARNFDT